MFEPTDSFRLRQAAGRLNTIDPVLLTLVRSALRYTQVKTGIPIALVVAGNPIRGIMTTPESFGRRLDDALMRFAELSRLALSEAADEAGVKPGDDHANYPQQVYEAMTAIDFSDLIVEDRRRLDEYLSMVMVAQDSDANWNPDPWNWPVELQEGYFQYLDSITAVTLDSASINVAGDWTEVGTIRVSLGEVSAWWPLELASDDIEAPEEADQPSR